MRAKFINESFFDNEDLEYVPNYNEKPKRKIRSFDESGEEESKKYVIIGSSEYGVEVLDHASSPEEAEELRDRYQISFGKDWTIDWKEEGEFDERDMTDAKSPEEKFVIIGINKDGDEEIIETADSEEEAESLTAELSKSFGNDWEIEYYRESEYNSPEDEDFVFNDDDYRDDDSEVDDEYFYDDSIKTQR